MSILFAIAFSLTLSTPHTVIPSTFVGGRVFAMPLVANSLRRLVLRIDSNGAGFIRSNAVNELHLQTTTLQGQAAAYLPNFDTRDFPPIADNHGALPVLNGTGALADPTDSGIDGQLGASWLADRIWMFDYVGHQVWLDHASPSYHSADVVPLQFDRLHRYASMEISIDGKIFTAALDTAAAVALSPKGASFIGNGWPRVQATSFARQSVIAVWHAAHPDWPYLRDGGTAPGVSLIRVPEVRANRVVFHDVWFSSRPNDDVFAGVLADVDLGPTAYGQCRVLIDYVHDVSAFQC